MGRCRGGRIFRGLLSLTLVCCYGITPAIAAPTLTPFPIVFTRTLPPNRTFSHLIITLYDNENGHEPHLWRTGEINLTTDSTGVIHICLGGIGDPAGFLPNTPARFYAFVQDPTGIPDADKFTQLANRTIDDSFQLAHVPSTSANATWQALFPTTCRQHRTGSQGVPAFLPATTARDTSSFFNFARVEVGAGYLGDAARHIVQTSTGLYFTVFGPQRVPSVLANPDGTFDLTDAHAITAIPVTNQVSFATGLLRFGLGAFGQLQTNGQVRLGAGLSIPLAPYLSANIGEVGTNASIRPTYGLSVVIYGAR